MKRKDMLCGDCLHFNYVKSYERVCNKLGVKRYAKSCSRFKPSAVGLASMPLDYVKDVARLFRELPPTQKRLFSFILEHTATFDKYGVYWGQPFAFSIGADVVETYYKAYLLSITKVKGVIYFILASTLKDAQKEEPVIVCQPQDSLFPLLAFKEHRKDLKKQGKLKATVLYHEKGRVLVSILRGETRTIPLLNAKVLKREWKERLNPSNVLSPKPKKAKVRKVRDHDVEVTVRREKKRTPRTS